MNESNTSVRSQVCKATASNTVIVGSNPTGRAKFTTVIKSFLLWMVTVILGFSLSIVMGAVVGWNFWFWMATNWNPERTFIHDILYKLF